MRLLLQRSPPLLRQTRCQRRGCVCEQVLAALNAAIASSDAEQLAEAIAFAQDWTSRRFPKDPQAAPVSSPQPKRAGMSCSLGRLARCPSM